MAIHAYQVRSFSTPGESKVVPVSPVHKSGGRVSSGNPEDHGDTVAIVLVTRFAGHTTSVVTIVGVIPVKLGHGAIAGSTMASITFGRRTPDRCVVEINLAIGMHGVSIGSVAVRTGDTRAIGISYCIQVDCVRTRYKAGTYIVTISTNNYASPHCRGGDRRFGRFPGS